MDNYGSCQLQQKIMANMCCIVSSSPLFSFSFLMSFLYCDTACISNFIKPRAS
jgi:hypothetical protein